MKNGLNKNNIDVHEDMRGLKVLLNEYLYDYLSEKNHYACTSTFSSTYMLDKLY